MEMFKEFHEFSLTGNAYVGFGVFVSTEVSLLDKFNEKPLKIM